MKLMIRIAMIVFGVVFIYGGFETLIKKIVFQFRGFPVSPLQGFMYIIIGVYLLYKCKNFSVDQKSPHYVEYYKCSKCKKIFKNIEIKENQCPDCSTEVEDLENYFERHPEDL